MAKKIAKKRRKKQCVFFCCVYTDESSLLMTENDHIPQTKASHQSRLDSAYKTVKDVDMVKADSRDFIYSSKCL